MAIDSTEKYWSDYYREGRDFICITPQELQRVLSYVSQDAPRTALDLGCGTGHLARMLCEDGFKVVGIDISEVALKVAESKMPTLTKQVRYEHGDIEKVTIAKLPFAPYGLIICQSVYAFIQAQERLLDEVKQALAPAGTLVIINQLNGYVPQHKKPSAVDPKDTIADLQKYFEVEYYEKAKIGYFICSSKHDV